MGNNLPNNVETSVDITCGKQERYLEEGKMETWYMSYYIGWSNIRFVLETTYDRDGLVKRLQFHFFKPEFICLVIDRAENNLLDQINTDAFRLFCRGTNFVNETKNRWDGVTKTNVAYNWSEDEGSLVVVEQKRKSGFEMPCEVTVAHYYAINSQRRNFIRQKKYDVGLSISVDIRVVDNALDLLWKGLSEHPSSALFKMFKQISRTWTWKWTACPHCAAQTHIQQFQTETENDDEESNYLQLPRQIVMGGNILANQGVIKGNNNDNFFVKQLNILRGG
ncbi:unnamed protein product [Trifolium pratense]|uniref:Uncharacterized protein n=1 Tax=Trifolium pratense TaxID=57577 RepID=A0ACB0IY79_TRIPR|nr:unnamed protein product [Trifolium pratense]